MCVPQESACLVGFGQLVEASLGTGVREATEMHSGQAALDSWGVHDTLKCSSSSSQAEFLAPKEDSAGDVCGSL